MTPKSLEPQIFPDLSRNSTLAIGQQVGQLLHQLAAKIGGRALRAAEEEELIALLRLLFRYGCLHGRGHLPGIGPAGGAADGSEMVIFDLFGFIPTQAMSQHAKTYADVIGSCIQGAAAFDQEVKNGIYPPADNGWSMDEKELDKFMNLLEQKY